MRLFVMGAWLLAMLVGVVYAADNNEERTYGPDLLRDNENVRLYRQSERGPVEYVSGQLSTQKANGNHQQIAMDFFESNKGAFRMTSPAEELRVKRVDVDELEMTHIRYDQYYQGVRVLGAQMLAHFTADGSLKTVNGHFHPGLDLSPTPVISSDRAIEIADQHLKDNFAVTELTSVELVVFPWQGEYSLCWRTFHFSQSPMGRWEYLTDAMTGEIRFSANRIMNENDVGTGVGVMGQPRNHIDTRWTGSVYEMNDYTRRINNNPHGHDGQMPSSGYIRTYIASSSLPGSIATDADNYWSGSTYAPAVDGHVYSSLMYDYLLHTLGRNGFDDNGASMRTSVNYSAEGDNNAYWNGNQIVIWSWSSGWRSLASCPDVIAHEWGHAVTQYCGDMVYQLEPGALNEAFSDMIGAAFEFAYDTLDTPDWLMGENGTTSGNGFRDMENPHNAGDPDFYGTSDPYWINVIGCTPSWTNDYCGVHTNSGVGNKWFFLLSDGGTHHGVTVNGIGVQNAMKIAYRANAVYWNTSTDYHEGALGTLSAADDLDPTGAWTSQAALAWNAVGVSTPLPTLSFAFPGGLPTTVTPGSPTTFEVVVSGEYGGDPLPGTGTLFYSVDGGAYTSEFMPSVLDHQYQATLPALDCGSEVKFYFRARERSSGYVFHPDTLDPLKSVPATSVIDVFSDDFETATGWTVSGNATDGQWSRGVPVGGGDRGDPATDFDGSGSCYLTDNVDGNSDVDGGTTILISPAMDCSAGDAEIHYARWYNNIAGDNPNQDSMQVYISNDNGSNWTLVENVGPTFQASGGWFENTFLCSDFVLPTAVVKLRFDVSDLGNGSVVEAAIDDVSATVIECTSGDGPQIDFTTLPDWTQGVGYSQQLTATGGTGELTWSDRNGDLVGTGLTLSSSGLLSGTPNSSGTISFDAEVVDEDTNSDVQPFSFSVNPAVSIGTTSLPEWTAGVGYAEQLSAIGGTGNKTWLDDQGDLSGSGLSLQTTGLVDGIPAAAGLIEFTARATDEVGGAATQALSINVNAPVEVTTTTLPDGIEGEAYSEQLIATNGTGNKTWADQSGDLSGTGLSLSSDGILSGTVATTQTIEFTAAATDQVGSQDTQLLSVYFAPAYICGDINGSGSGPDIEDLTYLVSFMFSGGPPPPVMAAADMDGDGDSVPTVGDLVWLVAFMFEGGEPLNCP